jgi:hypothetical protein
LAAQVTIADINSDTGSLFLPVIYTMYQKWMEKNVRCLTQKSSATNFAVALFRFTS